MEDKKNQEKIEKIFEVIFLIILFGSLIYFTNANIFQNKLTHPFPYSYFASDGFAYLFLTQHVYDVGNAKYHPFYASAGHENVIWAHGVILSSIVAIFSKVSGIEIYDSLFIIATFMLALTGIITYMILRDFNKKVAIISTGLFAFIFLKNFYITYLWGQLGAIPGMFFMVGVIWCILKLDIKKSFILLTILSIATILGHMPEFIFAVIFIIFFFAMKYFIEKKIEKENIKKTFIAILIAGVITTYYLLIFLFGVILLNNPQGTLFSKLVFTPEQMYGARTPVLFTDWGTLFIIMIFIGLAISLYYLFLKKNTHPAILSSIFLLVLGFSNYFGFGGRAFHIRSFWPFFIAFFIGISIYFILKLILKKIPFYLPFIIAILIFGGIVYSYYKPIYGPGIMDQSHWDAFQWINNNTEKQNRIMVLYGDGYSQSIRLLQRVTYLVKPDDYATTIQTGIIKREYQTEIVSLDLAGMMYWKTPFEVPGHYATEENITPFVWPKDICNATYYLIDKKTNYAPALIQLNLYMRDLFLKNNMTEVYSNDVASILKNNNIGGNCIAIPPKT